MDVEIREVTTSKDLDAFIRFPLDLYRKNPFYVPAMYMDERNTLRRDRNPAFEYCRSKIFPCVSR